jgi:trimeric autotransporter adhesin
VIILTRRTAVSRLLGLSDSAMAQSICKVIATVCLVLAMAILSIGPVTRALSATATAGPTAQHALAAPPSSKSIPTGLQDAIHRALGPAPLGLGTAPLVSGIAASSSGWSARVPGQGVSASISPLGSLDISPKGSVLRGDLIARAIADGTGTNVKATPLHVVSSSLIGGRLVQKMGQLSTSYAVTPAGFEQSFSVARAPDGRGGDLVLTLGAATGWALTADGTALIKHGASGASSLLYGGLKTTDARGSTVASNLRIAHGVVQIVVHGAATTSYPLDIDPTWTTSTGATASLGNSQGVANDSFGFSVALSADGSTALVSAQGVNSFAGAAYVFHVSGNGSWASSDTPTATLTDSASAAQDFFGSSVALSADGTTALIGAIGVDSGAGAAYVFHVADEDSWLTTSTPTAVLTISAPFASYVGTGVALSADGTTALIGASDANGYGAAYVFHVADEGSWTTSGIPTATLTDSAGAWADDFGISVALSADGTTALIGAQNVSSRTGAAYVFNVADEGSWASTSSPTAVLTNSGGASGDVFGMVVALSANGTTALVGADGVNTDTGAAYVFNAAAEGSWASSSNPATLTDPGSAADDFFGVSVALSADGTTALVGAYGANTEDGAGYVFDVPGPGSWASTGTPTATLTDAGSAQAANFGYAVAFSADGTTALIGAFGANSYSGAAYVFHDTPGEAWSTTSVPTATSLNSGGGLYDIFGNSVAISADGTTALVGAYGENSDTGAAYVFHVDGEGLWTSTSSPTAVLADSGSAPGAIFGVSVALSADGTTAVVGAFGANGYTGEADVFHVPGEGSWAAASPFSTPTATLGESDGAENDFFGYSVAISADGTTALIGAVGVNDGAGVDDVFQVASEASWASSSSPTSILSNAGGASGDAFGYSAALSADGTTAVVGASSDNVHSNAGAAYVFHVAGEGSWAAASPFSSPTATLTVAAGALGDQLGDAVALSADGTTALIGAVGVDSGTGAAYVFRVHGESSWGSSSTPAATLTNADGATGDAFGFSTALSADGTTAFVGANGASANSGALYVFHAPGEGSWGSSTSPTATLTNAAGASDDLSGFGNAVAVSADGTTALVGSVLANSINGAAFEFRALVVPTAPTISNLPASGNYGGGFSATVSTNGDGTTSVTSNSTGVCTATGLAVSYVGVGTCSLTAHVATGTDYAGGDGTAETFGVGPGAPSTPTISNLPASGDNGGGFSATVSTNGDGTTSVTSNSTGVCTATGLAVSYVGAGTCSLTAHVTEGTDYSAADGTAQTFGVDPGTPSTPVISNLPAMGSDGGGFTATVSTDGDGTTWVTSNSTSVCTASGLAVSYLVPGTCSLTAHVAAGTDYAAADGTAQTFNVQSVPTSLITPSTPTISNLPASGENGGGFSATVLTNGDGTTWVTSNSTKVCTVSVLAVSYVGLGTCSLTAHVAAGPDFAAADGTAQTFDVGRGNGYWLVASDGGVFSFGDAAFYGSEGATHLNKPIVGMAATSDGNGYWLVASDGGVFSFGDTAFYGSDSATHLNEPIVGMAATYDDGGYWLVGADGRLLNFGDAGSSRPMDGQPLAEPVVGMSS